MRSEADRQFSARRRADPAYREKQRIWNSQWHQAHKGDAAVLGRKAEQMREYRRDIDLALKHRARRTLRYAIETGKVTRQSCEVCGDPKSHGHHDDYTKPLSVVWLCRKHHAEHHAKAEGK